MKYFVKISHMPGRGGWGNGYVIIPVGNKLNGVHYDNIDVSVNGGLTFSDEVTDEFKADWPELADAEIGDWVVGFDTLHYGDTIEKWPQEQVIAETVRLKDQLEEMSI